MGFGYNPNLTKSGERLDMLSFFAYMQRLQNIGVQEWTIWDASGFYIVNRTRDSKIKKLGNKPKGSEILEVLINEQERPKKAEIKQNCDVRAKYLQRLIDITGVNAKYIDSRDAFREEKFADALDIALECVERISEDNPELVKRVLPPNSNLTSKLYLPLEMAEVLYLQDVNGKFGPETEEFFDKCIMEMQNMRDTPYTALWCPKGPRKPAYLDDKKVIWTVTSDDWVAELLKDPEYRDYVQQYLQDFQNDESLEDCAIRMRDLIGGAQ